MTAIKKYIYKTVALISVSLMFAGCLSAEVRNDLYLKDIETLKGKLQIKKEEINFDRRFLISLNDKVISVQTDYFFVSIRSVYFENNMARIILLAVGYGGSACPSLYKLIDADNDLFISEEFGNCSEFVNMTYQDGMIFIEMPSYKDPDQLDRWVYRDKQVVAVESNQ